MKKISEDAIDDLIDKTLAMWDDFLEKKEV